MNSLSDTYWQCLPRHSGIGSLPSATITVCSARIAESPDRELIVEIALYNPAMAKAISRISRSLFIGGGLLCAYFTRGEVYAESRLREQASLWIIVVSRVAPCDIGRTACSARQFRGLQAGQFKQVNRASRSRRRGLAKRRFRKER